jgi:hypothetical protein
LVANLHNLSDHPFLLKMRTIYIWLVVLGCCFASVACGDGSATQGDTDSTAAATGTEANGEWPVGLYYTDNWNNLQGYRLLLAVAESHGQRTLRLALHGGDVYYVCLPIAAEPHAGSGGKFKLVRTNLLPDWNGKATYWLFPEGEATFAVTGSGNNRVLNLTIQNKRYQLKYAGNDWRLPYQASLMSIAGASRAEHLFLIPSLPDSADATSNIIRGWQEYDKRHSPIEIEVVDRGTGLCRVRMKNFLYSPMSTTETETRVYKGKLVKSRTDWGGYDLVVDFGEGREVRYEVTVK